MAVLGDLQRRIADLERRVARLEGLETPPAIDQPWPVQEQRAQASLADPAPPPAAAIPLMPVQPPPLPAVPASPIAPIKPKPERAAVMPYQPQPAPTAPLREGAWEQTIGLKWAGWAGAVVLVIGAALAIKYSYDMWLRQASAELRLALMSAGGFALIAAGEWVYRRVHVWSAVGLFGSGVATLFLVAYAGHGYLHVYNREVAFVVMGAVTLIGAAVAMRGRLVSIAILSLIGGNLVPVILSTGEARLVALMSYLLMLQFVAVILAAWGGSTRWWTLRWFSLMTTAGWMAVILMVSADRPFSYAPLAFTLVYAAVFHAEVIISALRRPADTSTGVPAALFSVAVTAGMVVATLAALHDASPVVRGAWILGQAAVLVAVGFAIRPARILSFGLRMQAAGLVVIAVPVALSGSAVTIAWVMLALVYASMAAKWDLQASRIAAVVTWALAMLYVPFALSGDAHADALRAAFVSQIPLYVVLLWIGALAGHGVASLIALTADESRRAELHKAALMLSGLATAAWVVAAVAGLPPMGATISLVAYAWLLAGMDRMSNFLRPAVQTMVVLIAATLKWLLVDLISQGMGSGWTAGQLAYVPMVNPLTGVGVLLAASMVGVWYLRRDSLYAAMGTDLGRMRPTIATVVVIVAAAALTAEIDRVIDAASDQGWKGTWPAGQVKQLCWTMLWAISAGLLGALLWRMHDQPVRRHNAIAALSGVLVALVGKFIVIDTLSSWIFGWRPPGAFLANPEMLTALVLLGLIIAASWGLRVGAAQRGRASLMGQVILLAGVALVLFAGSVEIDRGLSQFGGRALIGRQVAWSIWWSIVAIGAVVLGFALRASGLRYIGLALFAMTVVKVFIVDLQNVSTGWRTLSFIGLGLLLMGTSVLYGKFSPRILNARRAP